MVSKPASSAPAQHSRLCIRRMSSRATLAPTDYHSRICPRSKYTRLQCRFRGLINRSRRSDVTGGLEAQDYFVGRLPSEIRLLIYDYLLRFDVPIKRTPGLRRRKERLTNVAILHVNRLVYREALEALYQLNTVVVRREELCLHLRQQLKWERERVHRLYISSLEPSIRCAQRIQPDRPATNLSCGHCGISILGLVDTLRQMPKLNNVFLDYHGRHVCIRALAEGLKRSNDIGSELQLICIGIGMYRLQGGWLGRISFELHDVPLTRIWSEIIVLPNPQSLASYCRATGLMWRNLKNLESRYGKKEIRRIALKLLVLQSFHDINMTPTDFLRIWPANIPVDFRRVSEITDPHFLHEFNILLQAVIDA